MSSTTPDGLSSSISSMDPSSSDYDPLEPFSFETSKIVKTAVAAGVIVLALCGLMLFLKVSDSNAQLSLARCCLHAASFPASASLYPSSQYDLSKKGREQEKKEFDGGPPPTIPPPSSALPPFVSRCPGLFATFSPSPMAKPTWPMLMPHSRSPAGSATTKDSAVNAT